LLEAKPLILILDYRTYSQRLDPKCSIHALFLQSGCFLPNRKSKIANLKCLAAPVVREITGQPLVPGLVNFADCTQLCIGGGAIHQGDDSEINAREVILKNYEDQVYRYPQVEAVPDAGAVPADDPARLTPLQRLPS